MSKLVILVDTWWFYEIDSWLILPAAVAQLANGRKLKKPPIIESVSTWVRSNLMVW